MNSNNKNRNSNITNLNKSSQSSQSLSVSFAGVLILAGFGVLFYFIFYRKTNENSYKIGYSYIPKNIMENNESILDKQFEKVENVKKCIDACKVNSNCNGMTFNKNTYDCKGFTNGILIKSEPNMIAWEKPSDKKTFSSKILLKASINNQEQINKGKITLPTNIGNFMFSCFLNITNWYNNNHTYWKSIFYKGQLTENTSVLPKTRNWEDIVNVLPSQCIGLWLAPYTNNLRICITTSTASNIENFVNIPKPSTDFCIGNKCFENKINNKNETNNDLILQTKHYTKISTTNSSDIYLEYYDILDIPINKYFFIAVNIIGNVMEIYIDDKLNYIINLKGEPQFNNSNLNAKQKPTFEGYIKNLSYLPYSASYKEIKKIYYNKP